MKLSFVWLVRNPDAGILEDPVLETDEDRIDQICVKVSVNDELFRIWLGTVTLDKNAWHHEKTTLYTEEGEAKDDAKRRLARLQTKRSV